MAPAVVHICLHGNTNAITEATADLTAFLRRAHIDARPTAFGEVRAAMSYPLDATAQAELEFALHAWQTNWPNINLHISPHG